MNTAIGHRNTIARAISYSNNFANLIANQPAVTAARALHQANNLNSGIKFVVNPVNAVTREGLHDMKKGFNNSITHIAATSSNNNLKAAVQGNSFNQVIPSGWLFKSLQLL